MRLFLAKLRNIVTSNMINTSISDMMTIFMKENYEKPIISALKGKGGELSFGERQRLEAKLRLVKRMNDGSGEFSWQTTVIRRMDMFGNNINHQDKDDIISEVAQK